MFSTQKKRQIYENSPFGAAIFNANLNVGMVASIAGVSRQTIYAWFDKDRQISFYHGLRRAALTQALHQLVQENALKNVVSVEEKIAIITERYGYIHADLLFANGEEVADKAKKESCPSITG